MSKKTGIEMRAHLRIGVVVDIELTVPGRDTVTVRTRNISDGGLFLILDDIEMPAIGTEVQVKVKNQLGDGEEAPLNQAAVVRHEPEGIGLKFL
jgi:c-di-GMP-binding flagellar brake protein YcgR